MALLEQQALHHDVETEALIKEARRLRRRRWLTGLCLAIVAASVGVAIAIVNQGPTPKRLGPAKPTTTAAARPLVNVKAFSGQGQLAFVSRDTLWVLNGTAMSLHQVALPNGLVPTAPSFSRDGRWLAFVTGLGVPDSDSAGGVSYSDYSLWMAEANGTHARRVTSLMTGDADAFGWNPRADLYAIAAGPTSTPFPYGQPTTVRLVSPSGSQRVLARAPAIVGAAWSPMGTSLAVSTMGHDDVPSLISYSLAGHTSTTWTGAPTAKGDWLVPAGWWNRWGVVYSVVDNGMVPSGEGSFNNSTLYSLESHDGIPRLLGETLINDSDGAPTATANGLLAFVGSTGNDPRTPMDGKRVEVCTAPSNPCVAAPTPAGDVSLDPDWSSSGSTLAYATAPDISSYAYGPAVAAWYNSHTLQLYDPRTGISSESADAAGATAPVWSDNGKELLYASHNGVWLLSGTNAQPRQISSPLFADPNLLDSYYGEVDWSQQFGWSTGAAVTECYAACDPRL